MWKKAAFMLAYVIYTFIKLDQAVIYDNQFVKSKFTLCHFHYAFILTLKKYKYYIDCHQFPLKSSNKIF